MAEASNGRRWRTLTSSVVYENPWIVVRQDEVQAPGGAPGVYGVVEVRQPSVFVVALTDDDEVVLVTVDRYTTGPGSLEVPAGGSDGEDPLVAARRELAEETGLVADSWVQVGSMNALNGIARAPEHVFLARGLHRPDDDGLSAEARHEEGITDVRAVPYPQVLDLIRAGAITDGETIAALALAALHLGRWS